MILCLPVLASALDVSGPIAVDTTWTLANSPYHVTGDVTVTQYATLTIEPGVEVDFVANADGTSGGNDATKSELIVIGSLSAVGTDSLPIHFNSAAATPAKGDWGGIRATWTSGNKVFRLDHCIVEYATDGIFWRTDSGVLSAGVSNSTIQNNSGQGIYVYGDAGSKPTFTISGSTITGNGGYGIYTYVQDAGTVLAGTITANAVTGNGSNGIYLYANSYGTNAMTVSGNRVSGNATYGIYAQNDQTYGYRSEYDVTDNEIYNNNGGVGFYGKFSNSDVGVKANGNKIYQSSQGLYLYSVGSDRRLDAEIMNNDVHDNTSHGIYLYASYSTYVYPELRGNKTYRNAGDGIAVSYSYTSGRVYPVLVMNDVNTNGSDGVYLQTVGAAAFTYNDVHDNAGRGLYLNAGAGSALNRNDFRGNAGAYEAYNDGSTSVDGKYNYWGVAATNEMALGNNPKNITRIYDIYDDGTKGALDYGSWLGAAAVIPSGPTSNVTYPADGSVVKATTVTIKGCAASMVGIQRVEVSPDGGVNWYAASGKESWTYAWAVPGDGTYRILSRVIDNNNAIETPGPGNGVTIDSHLPTTSGPLSGNETWSGVVTVTGDVTVPSGVLLTINAGTTVKFTALNDDQGGGDNTSRSELIVQGSLSAEGTESQPIRFTSTAQTPAAGNWHGIRMVTATRNESLTLRHCVIEYSNLGLDARGTTFSGTYVIDHSTIQYTAGNGVYIDARSGSNPSLSVTNSAITGNGGYGIYTYVQDAGTVLAGTITANAVTGNGSNGIYLYANSYGTNAMTVSGNRVSGNATYGIYAQNDQTYGYRSEYDVTDNEIYNNNGGVGFYGKFSNSDVGVKANGNKIYQSSQGLYLYSVGSDRRLDAEIMNNDVHDNTSHGIYLYASYSTYVYPELRGNKTYRNAGDGIAVSYSYTSGRIYPVLVMNDVSQNGGYGVYLNTVSVA